jgi:formylglycine-generating enzyme required for sulfatase activity
VHLNDGRGLVDVGAPRGAVIAYEPGWLESDDENIVPTSPTFADFGCQSGEQFNTWSSSPGERDNLPMDCVNWYEAYAFCIWDGGFLPTEAELEYATAGGAEERPYPWGFTDPGTENEYEIYGAGGNECYYPQGNTPAVCCTLAAPCSDQVSIAPVGTAVLGAGAWGHLDLLGELDEWTLDVYAPFVSPCSDCANLSGGATVVETMSKDIVSVLPQRAMRGSTFINETGHSWTREKSAPSVSYFPFGFRCARTP